MKLFLTKRPSGRFLLTYFKPTICRVFGTRHDDVYPISGEPISTDVCDVILKLIESEDIQVYQTIEIELTGRRL